MLKKEFIEKMQNEITKGQFVKATWKSETKINGETFTKISNGVVRFVAYGNINGVVVKGQANPNQKQDNQCEFLYHNDNTNNDLVQIATIKGQKAQSKYYRNGVEIDKATFETFKKPRKPRFDSNGNKIENPVFIVLLQNLLALGN